MPSSPPRQELYLHLPGAGCGSVFFANAPTVTVRAAAETITYHGTEYIRSDGTPRATGSVAPAANQTVRVEFVNSAGTLVSRAGITVAGTVANRAIAKTLACPAERAR